MSGIWEKRRRRRYLTFFIVSVALFFAYLQIYTVRLGYELPKTRRLRSQNVELAMKARELERRLDAFIDPLEALELRDEGIYRSVFALNSIPHSVREGGLASDRKYAVPDGRDRRGYISSLKMRSDMLVKKAFVQSRSYDEIAQVLAAAGNMANCIPAICPIVPDRNISRISSRYGYRHHPVLGYSRLHRGIDFSMDPGNPVYATGDAVVKSVKIEIRGYGRQVLLDHGFGYETRYAHLKKILVTEGMRVKRGEQIATTGNSGLTSGPHLHYEVLYKGRNVNPANYFDKDITLEQYIDVIDRAAEESEKFYEYAGREK